MRQKIQNNIRIRVHGIDLRKYTNLTCFVKQGGNEYSFNGTYDSTDPEVMIVNIPKSVAMEWNEGCANVQIAITDSQGLPHTHEPVHVRIGELLWEAGYGN